jgi:hypothetical protein
MPRSRTPDVPAAEPPRRLSLSAIVELLLQKSPRDHSSVTLSRNAKGDTQIEVVVRTGDDAEVTTPAEALAEAVRLYDSLREKYPPPAPTTPPSK